MKENRVKDSYEKINVNEETKNKMLSNILNSENKKSNDRCIIRKEFYMKKAAIAATIAICILVLSGTTYAAYKWMSAKQVAEHFGKEKIAEKFGKAEEEVQYAETDKYMAIYLGIVSGESLEDGVTADVDEKKSYVVAAVERKDGKKISYEENIVISPFIKGINPQNFNIYTMGGAAQMDIVDGVLYFIAESIDLEMFADRGVYIAVMDSVNIGEGYKLDENTGSISRVENYNGLNILFNANLDETKANPKAAQEYLQELNDYAFENEEGISIEDFEGHNNLKNYEKVIEKSTLVEGSETETYSR